MTNVSRRSSQGCLAFVGVYILHIYMPLTLFCWNYCQVLILTYCGFDENNGKVSFSLTLLQPSTWWQLLLLKYYGGESWLKCHGKVSFVIDEIHSKLPHPMTHRHLCILENERAMWLCANLFFLFEESQSYKINECNESGAHLLGWIIRGFDSLNANCSTQSFLTRISLIDSEVVSRIIRHF
jgi:hypothetical protein